MNVETLSAMLARQPALSLSSTGPPSRDLQQQLERRLASEPGCPPRGILSSGTKSHDAYGHGGDALGCGQGALDLNTHCSVAPQTRLWQARSQRRGVHMIDACVCGMRRPARHSGRGPDLSPPRMFAGRGDAHTTRRANLCAAIALTDFPKVHRSAMRKADTRRTRHGDGGSRGRHHVLVRKQCHPHVLLDGSSLSFPIQTRHSRIAPSCRALPRPLYRPPEPERVSTF